MSIEQAIQDADKQYADAFNRGDLAAVAALHTEDVLYLPPNASAVSGRQGVESTAKELFDAGWKNMSFSSVQFGSDGDLAYHVGTFSVDAPTDEGMRKEEGKFVDIYKRQADGSWKVHVTIFNSDTPLPD